MLYLARCSKEEKMKLCYAMFNKINWDLTRFSNKTDLFIGEVRKNAKEYIEVVLNRPLTKEEIWCLMPTNVRVIFNNHDQILNEMLRVNVINRNQLMDIDWMAGNLRCTLCEYCYNIHKKFNWINKDIREYCIEHNILFSAFAKLAYEYETDVLKYDDEQSEKSWDTKLAYRKNYILNNNINGIYGNLFKVLLKTDDPNKIINLFISLNSRYSNIKNNINSFMISYNIPSDIREVIFNKLNIYHDYLKENRTMKQEIKKEERENEYVENNIAQAMFIIKKYIDGQYDNINQFCEDMNLSKRHFDKYLELVKNNDEQLYNDYLEHIENKKNKAYEKLLTNSLIVIDLIKNGVVENGTKREFDLVDYYKYLPLGFDKQLRMVRDSINQDDYKLLCVYAGSIKNEQLLSDAEIENLYNMKNVVNVKLDEENNIIPGSGREITKEEKQNLINYLEDNNIPVTNKSYNAIYRRWLSGNLVLEEKDKTK